FLAALVLADASAHAQIAGDTLRLSDLQRAAIQRDARGRQPRALAEQSRLRTETILADRRPALTVESQAQYQSNVAHLSIALPGGVSVPSPAHDSYDAHLAAQQRLFDPTIAPRLAAEQAQLALSASQVRTAQHTLRQN